MLSYGNDQEALLRCQVLFVIEATKTAQMERINSHNRAVAYQPRQLPLAWLASIILKVPRKVLPGHSGVVDLYFYRQRCSCAVTTNIKLKYDRDLRS